MTASKKTAPEVASTTAEALIRPTGAELTSNGIMAHGRAYRKEPAHGMPDVPSPREEDGEGPEG